MLNTAVTTDLAVTFGLSEHELFRQALVSFLHEKKRQTLQLQFELLARYRVTTLADLEQKISSGAVAEHPTWEDLIVIENLTARLEQLNGYLKNLQQS